MKITKELRDEMAQVLGQANISHKTAQDIILMCNNGLTAKQALNLRGVNNPNKDTLTNLRKKTDKWLLARPEMQKLAHNAVKDTLKMKPIETRKSSESDELIYIYPRVSDRLAAASMVLDRIEPVKGNDTARQITNNIQVNINKYDNPNEITLDIDNGP